MMENQRYFVVSPDGFSIERDRSYETPEDAWAAFDQWEKRYEVQGYYSTFRGTERIQIPLEELKAACELKQIPS